MKRRIFSCAAGVSLCLMAGVAGRARSEVGAVNSGAFKSAVPVKETLNFGEAQFGIYRDDLRIPVDYGKLVTIVGGKDQSVLWFEADDGTLRNVIVDASQLFRVSRQGSLSFSY